MNIPESIAGYPLFQYAWALGIFAFFLIGAGALQLVLRTVERRLRRRSPRGLSPQVLGAVRGSTALFVALLGLFLALMALPTLAPWRGDLAKGWSVLVMLQVAYALANTTTIVGKWYAQYIAPRTKTQFDDRMLPILRRVVLVVIYGTGGLIVLDTLGIPISPLIGGLGITGLAVALALQPTLSNFFAGTYVLADAAINVGDYIELQAGPAGYVVEIGWRSTKIRTWLNNLVIVPNSALADTIVTNYQAPEPAMNIMVTCGVSYDSDLEKVERVSLEVAQEVLRDCPSAVKEMEPWFGFDTFGDSNIGFWVFLQARDRIGSFIVTNDLIKRLHARFAQEGIEINYPVRKLVYPDGAGRPVP